MRFMKPIDCTKYAENVSAQRIREIMKRKLFDLGYVMNTSGRYQYFIIPAKFFAWIDSPVPPEWR